MDYINTPSLLIYKHRNNLNDFGVQIPGTINNYLFSQMRRMTLLRTGDAKEIALQCFNNAYYICTLIQLEEFPDLCIDKYEKKLLEVDIPFLDDVCAASMGLVCKLLPAYDAQWKQEDNFLISSIRHWFSHNRWIGNNARVSFDTIMSTCNTDKFDLPKSEFAPRDIIEAIEEIGKDKPHLLEYGVEYICESLACMDDPRRRMYGADLAIAYLNDFLQDTYEDYGYNPMTNSFRPAQYGTFGAEPDFEEYFWKEANPIKEAIEYITKHYPNKEVNDLKEKSEESPHTPETEAPQKKNWKQDSSQSEPSNSEIAQLQSRIKELQEALDKEKAKTSRLEEQIADFVEPVENLTASQNVRIELAVQLLRAAGMSDNMLDRAYRKKATVARLIMLLTDIRSDNARNHPEHSCAKYLSDRKYLTKDNKDLIIEINNICVELGLNVTLSLGL